MAEITAAMVKSLRERSGLPMMDCKVALAEAKGKFIILKGWPGFEWRDAGMMKRPHPGATIVNTISVPSVDEYTEKVKAKGGKIVMEKMPIPGVGYMAYFLDTEGNPFGIMEGDPSAK